MKTILESIIDFKNGKKKPKGDGNINIYGGNGIIGYSDIWNYKDVLVIGRVGAYCGSVHLAKGKCWVSDNAIAAIPHNDSDLKYLYYLLKLLDINKKQIGSSQPLLTQGILNSIKTDMFSDKTYREKLGIFFSDIDEKIDINNKINKELEAMAKLIYDYWFVQFDFPDENGKPYKSSGGKMVYNEELKREIPVGWDVGEIQDLAVCIMGQSPKGESYNQKGIGIPLLNGPADYKNGVLKAKTYTTQPTRLCKKDDLILCIRATIGNLVYSNQEFCLGRGVASVRPLFPELSEYIYYLLEREIEVFKVRATGSIIKGITKEDLISAKVLVPNTEMLKRFSNIIKPYFDNIRLNNYQNNDLIELRDWLLPMLMNGQVKVN
tara:strand:+ start:32 stop:1165 length:1134 start_codon:yes stop_codon:yes gene_type:complete